jgi:Kre9/KNH-like N-terminal Ig-like domain/FlgD Ig-like domain
MDEHGRILAAPDFGLRVAGLKNFSLFFPGGAEMKRLLCLISLLLFACPQLAISQAPSIQNDPPAEKSATWNFSTSTEGWTGRNATARYSPDEGGRLYLDTYGSDPGVVSPSLYLNAATNDKLQMYIWTYCTNKNCNVYFMRSGSSTIYSGGSVYLANGANGGTYELDLSGNANWTGYITQIRIDPSDACGSVSSPGFIGFDWIATTDAPDPTIMVTSPNGGEIWDVGTSHTITWSSQNVTGNVLIQLWVDGSADRLITSSTTNDGSYTWTVTLPLDGLADNDCKIGISAMSGSVSDFSNIDFAIRPQNLTVTEPNGGEVWDVGDVERIQWSNPGGYSSITLQVSRNGGSTWSAIQSGLPGDYFFRDWTVTGPATTSGRIRVYGYYEGGSRYDQSNSSFTICDPDLDVTYPNGGQTWYMGHDYTVTWSRTACSDSYIKIELYRGTSPPAILQFEAGTPNDGSQTINIPVDGSIGAFSDYRIALSATDGDPWDFSDNGFTIASPTLTLLAPNGGEEWDAGTTHTITWSSNQVTGGILIQPYRNGEPCTVLTTNATNDGSYDWTIPVDYDGSSQYRIGISAMGGHVSDMSASNFTITAPTASLDITYPDGGQLLWAGHSFTATWDSEYVSENVKLELYRGTTDMICQFEAGTANDGNQLCALPPWLDAADDYHLAISTVSMETSDFSGSPFTISRPTIVISSPTEGAEYDQGQTVSIDWTTNQVLGNIHVEAYADGISAQVLDSNHPNDGHISWVIPDDFPDTEHARICMSAMDEQIYGESPYFTVGTPPEQDYPASIFYSQLSPPWDDDQMGTCADDMALSGCAVTCTAMLMSWESSSYSDPNPGELNAWLGANGGYTSGCLINWLVAEDYDLENNGLEYVESVALSFDDWASLDAELNAADRMPVVLVDYSTANTTMSSHFVVVYDRIGPVDEPSSYLILDPMEPEFSSTHTLAAYTNAVSGQTIFGLRKFSGTFPSVAPVLEVVSPGSGVTWEAEQCYDIIWDSEGVIGDVLIHLYKTDVFLTTIAAATEDDGLYSWCVPAWLAVASDYQVCMSAHGGQVYGCSDYFTIGTSAPAEIDISPLDFTFDYTVASQSSLPADDGSPMVTEDDKSRSGKYPPEGMDPGIPRSTGKAAVVLEGVPTYLWYNGCGPTAVGMVVGYWDGRGFDQLVSGDASSQVASVDDMMSSAGNWSDYCLPMDPSPNPILPDLSEEPVGDEHPDDSLADFMWTSRSYRDLHYGGGWFTNVSQGFIDYVAWVAPGYLATSEWARWNQLSWADFIAEIDAGRPTVFGVDSDANGQLDHFVTVIGYDDSSQQYACYNTWDTIVHWYDFTSMLSGQPFGVYGMVSFGLQNAGTFQISNEGGNSLDILSMDLESASPWITGISPAAPFTIDPGETRAVTFTVEQSLAGAGINQDRILVYSSDSDESPYPGGVNITLINDSGTSGVDDPEAIPSSFRLVSAYPNPFNPMTTLAYDLPEAATVDLMIYDMNGRLVRSLVVREAQGAGRNEVVWRGRDDRGRAVVAGVYFYRLVTGSYTETKRMTLIK